jgi:hypothetical protein
MQCEFFGLFVCLFVCLLKLACVCVSDIVLCTDVYFSSLLRVVVYGVL